MLKRISFSLARIVLILVFLISLILISIARPILRSNRKKDIELSVKPDILKEHVKVLSRDFYPRNIKSAKNVEAVVKYIKSFLERSTDKVYEQTYTVNAKKHINVVAKYGPESQEIIVIGAHYDSYHETPGADDNASGVAGLLELGNLLSLSDLTFRVLLVAYDTEEPPYFSTDNMGSFHHASYLKENGIYVKLMMSLEMIGYYSSEKGSQSYPHALLKLAYPSEGDFIAVIDRFNSGSARRVKTLMSEAIDLDVYSMNAPRKVPGIDFSDHINYWAHGYNAVMITDTAFYRNKEYHLKGDTYEKLNYDNMAQVILGVYWTIISLGKEI